jgi:adenylosuccinate synthase
VSELPQQAQDYVEFVSAALRLPIELVGVGAARERVLA